MSRYSMPRMPAARPAASDVMSGRYTCPELGRTCQRPGAYDAFDLPSLYGSHRHFPDGRVITLDKAAQK